MATGEPRRAGSTTAKVKWNGIDNQRCKLFAWHIEDTKDGASPSNHSCNLPLHQYVEADISVGWTLDGPFEAHVKARMPAHLLGPAFEEQTWDAFVFLTHQDIDHVRLSRYHGLGGGRFGKSKSKRCCCPEYTEASDNLQEQVQQRLMQSNCSRISDWLRLDCCLAKPPAIIVPDGGGGGGGGEGMLDAHGSGSVDRLREAMGCLLHCTSLSVYFTELGVDFSKLVKFYSEKSGLQPRMINAARKEIDRFQCGDQQDKTTVARIATAGLGPLDCYAATPHVASERPKKRQRQKIDGTEGSVVTTSETLRSSEQARWASVKAITKSGDSPFEREMPEEKQTTIHMSLAKPAAAASSRNHDVAEVSPGETQTTPAPPKSPDATCSGTRLQQLQETINGITEARVKGLEDALLTAAAPPPPPPS